MNYLLSWCEISTFPHQLGVGGGGEGHYFPLMWINNQSCFITMLITAVQFPS